MIKRSLFLLLATLFSMQQAFAWTPWWYYIYWPNILYYSRPYPPHMRYINESVSTEWETEVVNGMNYYLIKDILWEDTNANWDYPETMENILHMRKDGKRLLVIYDEYKKMMIERGYKSDDFDSQCRYEVTDEGEMVLYDFGMQVGDKFRSVPDKEDVYVVERYKEYPSRYTRQDTMEVIKLSNGVCLVDGIGYKSAEFHVNGTYYSPIGCYFDYLNLTTTEYGFMLRTARYDGEYVWEDSFDGGSSGIDAPWSPKKQGQTYDLNGRRLTGKPSQPGIYIQNGRKVVVK